MSFNKYDLVFLKHFAMVIVALHVIMVLLILGARWIHNSREVELPPQKLAEINARIAPVGAVYAGTTGREAILAAQAAAQASAATQVAYDGTLDGSVIYAKLCGACHTNAVGGAPAMTKADWAPRIAQGMDMLVTHAIDGYDGPAPTPMPARGGNPALTDEQVRATVQWMVDNLK